MKLDHLRPYFPFVTFFYSSIIYCLFTKLVVVGLCISMATGWVEVTFGMVMRQGCILSNPTPNSIPDLAGFEKTYPKPDLVVEQRAVAKFMWFTTLRA